LNILAGDVDDADFEPAFAASGLHEWGEHRDAAERLIADFETAMSPRVLFETSLLSDLPAGDRAWLEPLLHDLWLQRLRVRHSLETATQSLNAAADAYARLAAALAAAPETPTNDAPSPLFPLVSEFFERCATLSRAISTLPNDIAVV
jgi:hypothetical protein